MSLNWSLLLFHFFFSFFSSFLLLLFINKLKLLLFSLVDLFLLWFLNWLESFKCLFLSLSTHSTICKGQRRGFELYFRCLFSNLLRSLSRRTFFEPPTFNLFFFSLFQSFSSFSFNIIFVKLYCRFLKWSNIHISTTKLSIGEIQSRCWTKSNNGLSISLWLSKSKSDFISRSRLKRITS